MAGKEKNVVSGINQLEKNTKYRKEKMKKHPPAFTNLYIPVADFTSKINYLILKSLLYCTCCTYVCVREKEQECKEKNKKRKFNIQ